MINLFWLVLSKGKSVSCLRTVKKEKKQNNYKNREYLLKQIVDALREL